MVYIFSVRKINYLFVLILILFFGGDMFHMIDINYYYDVGLYFFSVPYLIICYAIIIELKKIALPVSIIKNPIVFLSFIFLLGFMLIVFTSLEISSPMYYYFYLNLGIQIVLMTFLAIVNNIVYSNSKSVMILVACLCFIISDLFFILHENIAQLSIFRIINSIAQSLSYYFLCNFFIQQSNSNIRY